MDGPVPDKPARDVCHVWHRDELCVARQLFGWNIFDWHLGIGVSIQLVDGNLFDVSLHFNAVDFAERDSVIERSEVLAVHRHQELLVGDDDLDGEAVTSEQVVASRESRVALFFAPMT